MQCIDLLASAPISDMLGPQLARRGPLPVRVITRIADLEPSSILVSDSLYCSAEDCFRLTAAGTEVVILAMMPQPPEEARYAGAGAAAYLNMNVGDRLISVLGALAGELAVAGRIS